MHPGDIFALTPAFRTDPGIAIAACRAGARGTLDLEYCGDLSQAQAAIARLERFTELPFGIKLGAHSEAILDALRDTRPERLGWLILAGGRHAATREQVERLRAAGMAVYFECVDADEMRYGVEIGADGLILKGHESGGRVGEETSFILVQRWFRDVAPGLASAVPVWVQGGIGLNTAAACAAAGVQGLVLDSQLLLAREAGWSESTRNWLKNFDGSQTAVFGELPSQRVRIAHWPRSPLGLALQREAQAIADQAGEIQQQETRWQRAVADVLRGASSLEIRMLGQDAVAAAPLAQRYRTVGGIVQAILETIEHQLEVARRLRPLDEGSPLAASHGTRFPILQGPMTRVSDTPQFIESVAKAGGLPFLALALLGKSETETLLAETQKRLGDLPWGAGILGFLPPEIRSAQTTAILATKPPFALIAGGRPDQAREFEEHGIPTYLHVPSPSLLRMFLKEGSRRFILEGRECGGHVGPRTSFALWDPACEVILEHLGKNSGEDLHVVFAGGIHDELSGAMVSAMAARLAERNVRVGVLMGTAYLFTQEAVESGGIVSRFQQEAIRCDQTVVLETGHGHAIRCAPTPYCDSFRAEKRRLEQAGQSAEEITRALEWMNVGRLRVASKGKDRAGEPGKNGAGLVQIADDEQYERGMYMVGQLSALRHEVTTMAELHSSVCRGGTERLETLAWKAPPAPRSEPPCDIAIIGMSCYFPGAGSLTEYWSHILKQVYSVTEVPESHWDWTLYYNADPLAKDKIISKWGGFLPDITIDPFRYGISPAAMKVIEPLQLLLLEAVRRALADAGYEQRPFARARTAAVCGIGGGGSPMATMYGFRACMPMVNSVPGMAVLSDKILSTCDPLLPEWTEDSFPGFLMNVAVGRVSNRFNLGGPNYAVDAACASSLAAVQLCIRELQAGTSDVALAMGADTVQTPFAYMAFSKTFALSRAGRCRPFDAAADGIVLSEGIGAVVLKRLADAERDGDRILAVIRGMGSSSDGREKGLTAPSAAGQTRALERAYQQARVSPARVALVEAHGTGTVVGDRTEAQSLGNFLRDGQAEPASCAVGSVKSMIGHSKCAAGIGGLIKTTMAVHRKVLPPTLVETPNPNAGFGTGPLYLNTQARPWIHGGDQPRCAGVSAFGFGGTNFHLVLEEYQGDYVDSTPPALNEWETELFVCRQPSRERMLQTIQQVQQGLSRGGKPRLADLAAALWRSNSTNPGDPVAAVVATSLDDLREKLMLLLGMLRGQDATKIDPRGVYFSAEPRREPARLAFLFPGQGSQYPNMLADLALAFPTVRAGLDEAERLLRGRLPRPLGRYLYPPSTFDKESADRQAVELAQTQIAQPALAAASLSMLKLFDEFGVRPDWVAGHSFGEYVALHAAGSLTAEELLHVAHRRGTLMAEAAGKNAGSMVAVVADAATVAGVLADVEGVTLANLNSPQQTVISASRAVLDKAVARLTAAGLRTHALPVAAAFHSPHVAGAAGRLSEELRSLNWISPKLPVFSNQHGRIYASEPNAILEQISTHLASPVYFVEQIEAMYSAGVRLFLEVGPQGVLTGLVGQILGDRPHVALASDRKARSGIQQLAHTLAQLLAHGVDVDAGAWCQPRVQVRFELAELESQSTDEPVSPSSWVVNGVRARPLNAPEPRILGQKFKEGDFAVPVVEAPPSARTEQHPAASAPITAVPLPRGVEKTAAIPAPSNNGSLTVDIPPRNPLTTVSNEETVDDVTLVMCRYQDLMARFLDTQQQVLRDYFQVVSGGTLAEGSAEATSASLVQAPQHAAEITAGAPSVCPEEPLPAAVLPAEEVPGSSATNGEAHLPAVTAPRITSQELEKRLLDLVAKRTGYPLEMLALDLDLEADLGVDSIKRVEILSSLAESIGGTESDLGGKLKLEQLTVIRTLQGIIEYLNEALSGTAQANGEDTVGKIEHDTRPGIVSQNGHAPKAPHTPMSDVSTQLEVQRALVELVEAPIPATGEMLIPAGVVLITTDDYGIARLVGQNLSDFGQRPIYIVDGQAAGGEEGDVYNADISDAEQVAQLITRIRSQAGQIAGLIHLGALTDPREGESSTDRARREITSLYLLARALHEDLEQAAAQGGAVLLAAMSLGGRLGFGETSSSPHYQAGHGGIGGFLKCVSQELTNVMVRAVDLDLDGTPEELADAILSEFRDPHGPVEIGRSSEGRFTWRAIQAPLSVEESEPWPLEPGAPVLITGGARGITARIAVAMAHRGQPHLILVGRTPLPEDTEPADVANLVEPADIKRALMERLRVAGRPSTPAAVETLFRQLMAAREVRATLNELTAAGSTWEYHALDVRDREAFVALIEDLNRRSPLQGLIHGAGVIEDKLLRDKTLESFDRVWRTKVNSALALSESLDASQLRFAIFFSSLASRYGNRGQADYAAANEVLSKLAIELDRRWSARVCAIAWGPWSGVGMVAELEPHLTRRGLKLIDPHQGPQYVLDEILAGSKGESEVIIAGGAERLVQPRPRNSAEVTLPAR